MEGPKEKKKFDKKAYRAKKYDNKAKLQEWKEKRKVAMEHKYKKLLRKQGKAGPSVLDIYKEFETERIGGLEGGDPSTAPRDNSVKKGSEKLVKKTSLNRAKQRFEEKKDAAAKRQEEFLKRQKDREEALKKYRQKKDLRFKKLNAKNKKGQPLMGGRIELLLEKIQQQMAQ